MWAHVSFHSVTWRLPPLSYSGLKRNESVVSHPLTSPAIVVNHRAPIDEWRVTISELMCTHAFESGGWSQRQDTADCHRPSLHCSSKEKEFWTVAAEEWTFHLCFCGNFFGAVHLFTSFLSSDPRCAKSVLISRLLSFTGSWSCNPPGGKR